jgi:2-dehydro-3-deoxyphosphogalactonate aldolase
MTTPQEKFEAAMRELPLVAILRGLTPPEAADVGDAIVESGFRLLEVPLNSPKPYASIALMRTRFPEALVGAGTVLDVQQVRYVHSAGGELIVSPNFNAEVVAEAVRLGMVCLPGVMTPTEAFGALAAGATGLKLFPAELASPAVVKALLAVLPAGTPLMPVGGRRVWLRHRLSALQARQAGVCRACRCRTLRRGLHGRDPRLKTFTKASRCPQIQTTPAPPCASCAKTFRWHCGQPPTMVFRKASATTSA